MDKTILIAIGSLILLVVLFFVLYANNNKTQSHDTSDRVTKNTSLNEKGSVNIDTELKQLVLEGRKIEAIKRYRTATGAGLKEAKDYVDKLSEI